MSLSLGDELRAHLMRLGEWAVFSSIMGAALLVRDSRDGAGPMMLGWGLVNGTIALLGLRGAPPTDAEAFRRFLLFNLGLNVLWIAIGVAMLLNRANPWVYRAGAAMTLQAVVLMALDLLLFWRVRR